ncbi:hypothetical protein JCGZ_02809 [Jatropha curcas]|uniref:Uncharacterized protein n=1 Tax=Jatropha curcas TaxID=180498 RepID=A0A067L1K1_JATCU|nr:hypothetical protein JCGZ_02809 [Jatropha curcas]
MVEDNVVARPSHVSSQGLMSTSSVRPAHVISNGLARESSKGPIPGSRFRLGNGPFRSHAGPDSSSLLQAHSFPASVSSESLALVGPSFVSVELEDGNLGAGRSVGTEPAFAVVFGSNGLLRPDEGLGSELVEHSEGSIGISVLRGQREPKPPDP